jgi:hypothetical protein
MFFLYYYFQFVLVMKKTYLISSVVDIPIPFFSLCQDGFVNSLAIANSGRFIVAGVGQVSISLVFLKRSSFFPGTV